MTKQLPPITPKQHKILTRLYRYRFLNRTQIQTLLNHKHKGRILAWLKDLKDKQYVDWHYDPTDFVNKTKPAIYYLSLNGIRYLRQTDAYPAEELRKRYKESTRKQSYINKCLLIAECCIDLREKSVGATTYSFTTQSEFAEEDNEYNFLTEINPSLFYIKQKDEVTTNRLLDIFDSTLPRHQLRKRLKDYVDFVVDGTWQENTGDAEPPYVLLAFSTLNELIYAKRRIRQLLEEEYGDEVDEDVHFGLATIEQVRDSGVTGSIWEEA